MKKIYKYHKLRKYRIDLLDLFAIHAKLPYMTKFRNGEYMQNT